MHMKHLKRFLQNTTALNYPANNVCTCKKRHTNDLELQWSHEWSPHQPIISCHSPLQSFHTSVTAPMTLNGFLILLAYAKTKVLIELRAGSTAEVRAVLSELFIIYI